MISILYVDDESTLLMVTKTYLERTGDFLVTTCTSANEAIALLLATPFDAIVSDYQMPGMDGIQFLQQVRSSGNAIPFILFTGKGREEVAIEALNSGADFYLQKGGEPKSQFAEMTSKIRQAVQRRQAETALLESEEKYRDLVENINDVLFQLGSDGSITYVSPIISQFGYAADDMIGRPVMDFIAPEDRATINARFSEVMEGTIKPQEFRIIDGSGAIRFVRTSSRPIITGGKPTGITGVMTDITERMTAEARVHASEQRYRSVFEAAGDAMLIVDEASGRILDANRAALTLFSYTLAEIQGMLREDLLVPQEHGGEPDRTLISGIPFRYCRDKGGVTFPADILTSRYPDIDRNTCIYSIRNIASQVQAEERSLAAQRLYEVLSRINSSIVRVRDLETLVSEICRISVEYGKFRMAWVGLLDKEAGTLRPVARAGAEDGFIALQETTGSENMRRKSPIGIAIHESRFSVCNDIESDPVMEPWQEEAVSRGYRSMAAFPFRLHGEVIGAYMIYASRRDFFNKEEIALLEEIASDISFALDMLDEQARRSHAERALAGSEERAGFLAEVLEVSSLPFGVAYPGGAFGIVNPAFCDLVGYTDAELHALKWTDITLQESSEQESRAISEIKRTGIPQRYEKVYIRKDGSRVPVEILLHRVVDDGGNIRFFYGFVTDISERIRAERRIKAERDRAQKYLDTAGVMLAAVTADGTITLINRKGCEILGYAEEELIGKNWIDLCLPERVRDEVRNLFCQVAAGDVDPVAYHENVVITKSGEEHTLAFHNNVVREGDTEVTGILFSGEDITLRKRMEAALLASEERFRNLIQNSSDMVRIIGADGLITYSSPSTLRIKGFNAADVIGKSPLEFVHPDDRSLVAGALREVENRTNPGTPTEYRIRRADGSYIFVEAIAANLQDVAGINGIVTTTRPITERKMAEQELRESEGRYRALFMKSADAIFVVTDQIIDCNPEAERMFGWTRDEMLGLSVQDISPPVQPGGRSSEDLAREYNQAAIAGTMLAFSWTHCRKDKTSFPAHVTLIPATILGKQRVMAIVHDCTESSGEAKKSRHLARIPEMNPNPVIEVRRDREIVYANPASKSILKSLGMPADPAAFLPEDFEAAALTIEAEQAARIYREVRIGNATFGAFLSFDREDQLIRIYAHDITLAILEREALEQATKNLNRLAGITRHDIKNKLTGVMGYLELARGSTKDPDLVEYLTRAETSATAVRAQIEFTKEYENLGISAPRWQEVSAVLTDAARRIEGNRIPIADETDGLLVYADLLFVRVVHTLLENSVVHGKPVTRIRAHGSVTPSGYRLVIEDDGVGIPADQKEKIFGKKTGREAGAMGLFVCREILSVTGITLEETGAPGNGARFEMFVPSGKFQLKSPD